MEEIYFDQDDNIIFNDVYLDQIVEESMVESTKKKENKEKRL